jgi:hypothetical protein
MAFDCKTYCQNCIVCNRAKSDRRGASRLHPLGVPEYPWEIVGIYYVTDLPSGSHGYASPLRNHVNWLSIIVIDYIVFLKLLYHIEILILLRKFGKAL